jgi:hypothetical protein
MDEAAAGAGSTPAETVVGDNEMPAAASVAPPMRKPKNARRWISLIFASCALI